MSPHAVRLQRDSGVGTPDKVSFLNVTAKAAEKSAAFVLSKQILFVAQILLTGELQAFFRLKLNYYK